MTNTLAEKVTQVIATVEPIYREYHEPDDFAVASSYDGGLNREEFKQFEALAEEIYILAAQLELDRHLPKVAEQRANLGNAPSWLRFETALNLPGW